MLLALHFDALKLADRLQRAGLFQQPQAIEFSRVLGESLAEGKTDTEILTRADVQGIEADVNKIESRMQTVESDIRDIRSDLAILRVDIKSTSDSTKATILQWMFGMLVALGGFLYTVVKAHP